MQAWSFRIKRLAFRTLAQQGPDRSKAPEDVLAVLNARSQDIFRKLVERYLDTGTPVASRDLARMLSALGREEDIPKLLMMRRLIELDRSQGRSIER